MNPDTQNNEVARLSAEVQRAIEDRNRIGIEIRGEYLPKLKETNNEVARLREEKDKIAEIAWEAVNRLFDVSDSLDEIPLKLQTQLEALDPIPTLAPAPEEPTHEGITMDEWYGGFTKIESKEPTTEESLAVESDPDHFVGGNKMIPEWREFTGTDELVLDGDEREIVNNYWQIAGNVFFGCKASQFPETRFRTRRPLPKQEEMPLEKELDYLTKEASRAADIHNHVVIVDCLRYLRDEIEALKKNQK